MRVLVFLGLKVVEISALVFVPWLFGFVFYAVTDEPAGGFWLQCGAGAAAILFIAAGLIIIGLLGVIISGIIKANLKWSRVMVEKFKR